MPRIYTNVKNTRCTVPDCDRMQRAMKLCSMHYHRFLRYGDVTRLKQASPGTGFITKAGYARCRKTFVHVAVVEKALGKALPIGAVVHHVDGNRSNNANGNLVVCQNSAYHNLLHARQRAFDATGNPNARHCEVCKNYDLPENLSGKDHRYHKACATQYQRDKKERACV